MYLQQNMKPYAIGEQQLYMHYNHAWKYSRNKNAFSSKAGHPRMRVSVTWQRWRSHHASCHSKNPMLHANFTTLSHFKRLLSVTAWAAQIFTSSVEPSLWSFVLCGVSKFTAQLTSILSATASLKQNPEKIQCCFEHQSSWPVTRQHFSVHHMTIKIYVHCPHLHKQQQWHICWW